MTNRDWDFTLEPPDPKGDLEAYVGLREKDGRISLRVPHGYPLADPELDKPRILGELMRVVARFSEAFPEAERSDYKGQSTRDGFLKQYGGQSFRFEHEGADLNYSNLSRYVQLMRRLRDPRLLALVKAPGLTTQFDHRYISRNLERATFLADGTPLFDHLWAPSAQMRHTTGSMVGLACWMALDGLRHLFPDTADHEIGAALRAEWEGLACRFSDDLGLNVEASLFTGRRVDTLAILQSTLEICIRRDPPMSTDARDLHRLLNELLHHAFSDHDGDIWGLRGFHHVWESACLEHALSQYGIDNVFTCDDTYWVSADPMTRSIWENNRDGVFHKNGIPRRPDLVVKKDDDTYLIVDFKYYAESELIEFIKKRPSEPSLRLCDKDQSDFCRQAKTFQDIVNIEVYRWLLMQHGLQSNDESKVMLELWVPGSEDVRRVCSWMGLTLVAMPACEVLGAYARKFHLMD